MDDMTTQKPVVIRTQMEKKQDILITGKICVLIFGIPALIVQ